MLLPLALIAVITTVDVLAPPQIHLGPLLVVAPAITASFAGTRLTAAVGLVAVSALTVIGAMRDGLTTSNHETQIAALVVVSALVVVFCAVRDRHARELVQVRSVSEAAQRVLLRPLPSRIGPLRIASVYLAAEAEAQIGGDLYAAARTATGTRLIVGDVRGKGLTSLGEAALLLGAFRASAHLQAELPELAAYLDGSVSWELAGCAATDEVADRLAATDGSKAPDDLRDGGTDGDGDGDIDGEGDGDDPDGGTDGDGGTAGGADAGESFITAVIVDIPDDGTEIRIVNCGHPPPLLLHRGEVVTLEARRPAPPLGLGGLVEPRYHADVFPFEAGDRLLLYTDGVIEARDAARSFYPFAERVGGWAGEHPGQLLQHLRRDLLGYAGGRLGDDAAVVAVERVAAGQRVGGRAPTRLFGTAHAVRPERRTERD
ncbi:PP2C family protein-serine/threonine phosphatase [Kitasatospora nipponensis]|uniref:PP2C family protein-serine/threonine phosphatase n=1 Tax=Kitasatospora nipponensis TaxID=258049 RepID=UPI0031D74DF3